MNIEEYLHNIVAVQRAEEMKTSQQLTLGELILKLEDVEDKHKPIIFDAHYHPTDIDSWRGSYCELAVDYVEEGTPLATDAFLQLCKQTVGSTQYGYKGGDFLMDRSTPVWVANYGESEGFRVEGDITTQAVVDVSQDETSVILETKCIDY